MKNKEEIIYNCRALIDTWLNGNQDKVQDLRIIFDGDCRSVIINCTPEDAGEKIGDILYEQSENYKVCRLVGVIDREQKEFGRLDIKKEKSEDC